MPLYALVLPLVTSLQFYKIAVKYYGMKLFYYFVNWVSIAKTCLFSLLLNLALNWLFQFWTLKDGLMVGLLFKIVFSLLRLYWKTIQIRSRFSEKWVSFTSYFRFIIWILLGTANTLLSVDYWQYINVSQPVTLRIYAVYFQCNSLKGIKDVQI